MNSEIIKKTYGSISYQLIFQILQQISIFALSIIVARLISPAEFGVIALANLIIQYANSYTDLGFTNALVQNKNIEETHINSVFSIDFSISLLFALITFVFADNFAAYFNNEQLADVLRWMSLYFIFTTLYYVPRTVLRRNLDFKFISVLEYIQSLINYGATIVLAYLGFSYWSIIYPNLALTLIVGIIYCYKAGWMPKLKYKHSEMADVYSFGIWNFIRSQVYLLINKVDYFVIGKNLPVKSLGIYEKAFEISSRALQGITMPINSVFFSSFSRLQDDTKTQKEMFLDAIKILTTLSLPIIFGMIAVADRFIIALLGEAWIEAIVPLKILSIAILFKLTGGIIASLNIANGHYKQQTLYDVLVAIILVLLCIFLIDFGILGISFAILIYSILGFFIYMYSIKKTSQIKLFEVIKCSFYPMLLSLIMFGIVTLTESFLTDLNSIPQFFLLVLIGMLVFIPGIWILNKRGIFKLNFNFSDLKSDS